MSQTVLIVDDEATHAKLVGMLCERLGHRALLAGSGLEALAILDTARVDLVLMDVRMPGMSGLEATRRIRGVAHLARLPIVFMTADVVPEALKRLADLNPAGVVLKPFEMDELGAIVQKNLARAPRAITFPLRVRGTSIQLYDPGRSSFAVGPHG